ncbi:MAG: hypothetical protein J4431_02985 [Candidatus Aenigmarchaeota archaeon]|nr:hypothetical protein [Candidatus Aenigmarchaeota archaeon]
MSYNPIFGIGECTALGNAIFVLWLQSRQVDGVSAYNGNFDAFYGHVTDRKSLVLLPDGKLTMQGNYKPVDFANLRVPGEDLHEWSVRMQSEYPFHKYEECVNPEDRQYLLPII